MISIKPKDIAPQEVYRYLIGGVAPRPIALVSTLSAKGVPNLSPFSFFNAFGANPPTVCFSPTRRMRDNTEKDTYHNLQQVPECVVHSVTHAMSEQVNLASGEYDSDIDEFKKSGFTPIDSDLVRPKRVKESPFQMECKVTQIIPLGKKPGSGNLAICEVIKFHIDEHIVEDGNIKPQLADWVGRNSESYYTRASGSAIFSIPKTHDGEFMGFENLPDFIRTSNVYTANNLGRFATAKAIPGDSEVLDFIRQFKKTDNGIDTFEYFQKENDYESMLSIAITAVQKNHADASTLIEKTAKCALENNDLGFAWKTAVYKNLATRK